MARDHEGYDNDDDDVVVRGRQRRCHRCRCCRVEGKGEDERGQGRWRGSE